MLSNSLIFNCRGEKIYLTVNLKGVETKSKSLLATLAQVFFQRGNLQASLGCPFEKKPVTFVTGFLICRGEKI
jgi:hypothetical protein